MFKLNPTAAWLREAAETEENHDFVVHQPREDATHTMYYTGIGSRFGVGASILAFMTDVASKLEAMGYTLRSGGASGSDTAFEEGVHFGHKEIYLPWANFNGNKSPLISPSSTAMAMAERYHPAWHRCKEGARKLHARNCHQVLGRDLETPSKFVVCWTPGGLRVGGTAQALRIALEHSIPIINFAKPKDMQWLLRYAAGELCPVAEKE